MQVDLSGLRALVTGSTKGIGFAVAQKPAASGAEVAVNGRKATDVEAAIAKIRATVVNAKLLAAPGDVAIASGVDIVIIAEEFIDISHVKASAVIPHEHLHTVRSICETNLNFGRRSQPGEFNCIRN